MVIIMIVSLPGCNRDSPRVDHRDSSTPLKLNYSLEPFADVRNYEILISDLDSFLRTKNQRPLSNPFWMQDDYIKNPIPFKDILAIEAFERIGEPDYFKPTVLNIIPTESTDEYVVKLAFVGCDSMDRADVRAIYNIVAVRQGNGYKFKSILDRNTAGWHKERIGDITFVFRDSLNRNLAKRTSDYNIELANQFRTPPIPLTYYKCRNAIELSNIKGFDYSPIMYLHTMGGRGESWSNTLFAGNNSEWYPRELIPFYITRVYGQAVNYIFKEGYATFQAGAAGRSFNELLALTQQYYTNHPERDVLADLLQGFRIEGYIDVTYPLGGLLCKLADEKSGAEGVTELLRFGSTDEDFFRGVESVLGVRRADLASYLLRNLGVAYAP